MRKYTAKQKRDRAYMMGMINLLNYQLQFIAPAQKKDHKQLAIFCIQADALAQKFGVDTIEFNVHYDSVLGKFTLSELPF